MDKLLSVVLASRDGRTADAEHQRQQWRHIHVVYGPPHDQYARFAMPAMLGASAAEIRWLLISSHDSGGLGDGAFASLALPHLWIPGILHLTWVGIGLGTILWLTASTESVGNKLMAVISLARTQIHKLQMTVFHLCECFSPSTSSHMYLFCPKSSFFGEYTNTHYKMTSILFVYL